MSNLNVDAGQVRLSYILFYTPSREKFISEFSTNSILK